MLILKPHLIFTTTVVCISSPEWCVIVAFPPILLNRKPSRGCRPAICGPYRRGARTAKTGVLGLTESPQTGGTLMKRIRLILGVTAFLFVFVVGTGTAILQNQSGERTTRPYRGFELDVIVDGRALNEYFSRGRT